MIWYQKFEYAVGHWLQKATEHMIGCVLCSPGCFSLFRSSALMDDNVARKYATKVLILKNLILYIVFTILFFLITFFILYLIKEIYFV